MPKNTADYHRSRAILIRPLSPEQAQRWRDAAETAGESWSDFARAALDDRANGVFPAGSRKATRRAKKVGRRA